MSAEQAETNLVTRRAVAGVLATIAALFLILPSVAGAGTWTRSGGTLNFVADSGHEDFAFLSIEDDKLQVSAYAQDDDFNYVEHVFHSSTGCKPRPDDESYMLCNMPTRIVAALGDEADRWEPEFGADVPIPMEVNGGAGDDTVYGGSLADTIVGGGTGTNPTASEGDYLLGGEGNDTISDSGPLYSTLVGGGGGDTLTSASEDANLMGDDFDGAAGNDTLTATGDLAFLSGGAGADLLNGGPGNDVIDGDEGDDRVNAGGGDDDVYGGDGSDTLNGQDGKDSIMTDGEDAAAAGDDTVNGGPGDDAFEPTAVRQLFPEFAGADTYIGGDGFDYLNYFWATGPVHVSLDGVANDGQGDGDNVGSDVEEIGGTSGNDTLIGDSGPQVLIGYEGDDTLQGLGGNDELNGGDFVDTLDGGGGDDVLYGGTLSDTLTGGPGRDQLFADDVCTSIINCFAGDADTINADDGEADTVFCHGPYGPETPADTAVIDGFDDVKTVGLGACRDIRRQQEGPPEKDKCAEAKEKVKLAKAKLSDAKKKAKKAKGKKKAKAKKKVKRAKGILKDAKDDKRKQCR